MSYLPDMAHFGPESTRAVELLGALLSKAVLLPSHVAEFLDLEAVSSISEDLPKAVDVISLIIVKVPHIQFSFIFSNASFVMAFLVRRFFSPCTC